MFRRAAVFAFLPLAAAAASAQEYGRSSSGELQMFTKQPSKLSMSLGLRLGTGKGYEGTVGGTLIRDRMWFFASGLRDEMPATTAMTETKAAEAKITLAGASEVISGSYSKSAPLLTVPQSFLNLRYTGIISDNAFFTAHVSAKR